MEPLRMVVTDGYTLNPGDNPWDEIGALGTLTVYERTAPAELTARCREAEILIVNKTRVRAEDLNAFLNRSYQPAHGITGRQEDNQESTG